MPFPFVVSQEALLRNISESVIGVEGQPDIGRVLYMSVPFGILGTPDSNDPDWDPNLENCRLLEFQCGNRKLTMIFPSSWGKQRASSQAPGLRGLNPKP